MISVSLQCRQFQGSFGLMKAGSDYCSGQSKS